MGIGYFCGDLNFNTMGNISVQVINEKDLSCRNAKPIISVEYHLQKMFDRSDKEY